jgi:hypothetical protein
MVTETDSWKLRKNGGKQDGRKEGKEEGSKIWKENKNPEARKAL